ncbi:MAG TPA: 1-acyl-sn-glycerol-3-phosphate acyltransferase [Burkholderiaceae bacterium]|jgi:1-acyl-sn-glycerol-3-phosphate acyltransferase|nr:1-acyl-sn-glycerol-3-phosphate acyltransferase [Burkholderiaceae bacterium]
MNRTIFGTPVVNTVLRASSIAFLKLAGWRIEGSLPADATKCVLIAAPHTSNWDLPYTLMTAFVLRLNVYWMGKASIFRPPFGPLMRWLGGIAVKREQSNNMVEASAAALRAAIGTVQLIVPPEGTRSATTRWRTGFYYIALTAGVPIQLAFMDYSRKRAGLGPVFQPTGDIDSDMLFIKAYYAPFRGKNAHQFDAG